MIYVDELQDWGWRLGPSSHMFTSPSDDISKLHAMASKIGMKRSWFQNKPGKMPHYDLVASKHAQAIRLGAKLVTRREMVEIMNQWKEPK